MCPGLSTVADLLNLLRILLKTIRSSTRVTKSLTNLAKDTSIDLPSPDRMDIPMPLLSVAGGALSQDICETQPPSTANAIPRGDESVSPLPVEVHQTASPGPDNQIRQPISQQTRQLPAHAVSPTNDACGSGKVWTASNIHEWQPDQWYPSAIVPYMFRPGSSTFFPHWIDGGKVGYPAILPSFDLFRSLLRSAWTAREYQAADARRQKERERILTVQHKLWEDSKFREDRMISRREQLWRSPRDREQRHQDDDQARNLVDENRALREQLSAELVQLDVDCANLQDRVEDAHDTLMPLLDDLFGDLGALPDFTNPQIHFGVRVFENWKEDEELVLDWPENTWNDPLETGWTHQLPPGEWLFGRNQEPEETFNNAWEDYPQGNPVAVAELKVEKAIQAYKQVSLEFDEHRNNYDGNLYWYIAGHHKFRMYHDNEAEIAELEQQFDAEWFVKYRHIAQRLERAEMHHRDAEKERLEAERLISSEDNLNQPVGHLAPIACEEEVKAFGEILSSTQLKRIDGWLNTIPSLEDLEPVLSFEDIEASVGNLSPRKRKRMDELDSDPLSKRQRSLQESNFDDTVAMLDVPEHFGWVETWELAVGYQRQLIDDYAQQSRQAWEETKTRL